MTKKEKRKLFLKIRIIFCSILVAMETPDVARSVRSNVETFFDNPEYSTILTWNYLSESAKETLILRKIKEALTENENLSEQIKRKLANSYEEYLEECSKYLTWDHYLKILETTKNLNFELLEEPIKKAEGLKTLGWADINATTIHSVEDANTIFHEKLHFDYNWKEVPVSEELYYELHSSLFSKFGYLDLDAMIRLIGELVGTDVIAKNIVNRTPEYIWEKLENMYLTKKAYVHKMRELIETIYKKEYIDCEDVTKEKEEFWHIYSYFYYEKFEYFPENDIIGQYLKERMFIVTPLLDFSDVEYESTYYIGNFAIPLKDRKRNYKDVIIEELFNREGITALYFQDLWKEAMLGIHKRDNMSYQEFESSLKNFFSEGEIRNLFNQMITCETEEQYLQCRKWIHANIFSIFGPDLSRNTSENLMLLRK